MTKFSAFAPISSTLEKGYSEFINNPLYVGIESVSYVRAISPLKLIKKTATKNERVNKNLITTDGNIFPRLLFKLKGSTNYLLLIMN